MKIEGVLLDTNVLSELTKPRPHPRVIRFYEQLTPKQVHASVLSLGELRKGVVSRASRDRAAADQLAAWMQAIESAYSSQILAVTTEIARLWGELSVGRTRPAIDTLLAATAIHHGLTFATRNTRDVHDLPVILHNPWLD